MWNSAVMLLERAAERWPDNTAVEDFERSITYKEYREESRKVASGLLRHKPDRRPVIVYLPKGIKALCSFMGAMYCGCPYAPVDSHIPVNRLKKIIDSLDPAVIITNDELCVNLQGIQCEICIYDRLAGEPVRNEELQKTLLKVADTDPIYIIYTSGSTGTPKGVTIAHRGIIDYSQWVCEKFGFDTSTVMANQAPFYFDNSTFDIYGSLRAGGKLYLVPENMFHFPSKLPELLAEKKITSIFWVPTVMINIANSGVLDNVSLPDLKNVAFAGEVMPNKQLNQWRCALPGRTFANLYGPTEITDVCCYYIVDRKFADNEPLPLGKSCENMRIEVITEDGRRAEVNEEGEICVIGSGVALGYWNAPEQTAAAFVHNPLTPSYPERMYRSGDLGYWNEEGLLMFVGRRDSQIKLKGNRIELGEVEAGAMCVSGTKNACAVFDDVHQLIVLFVESSEEISLHRYNMELRRYIPNYMLPGKLKICEKLPHTANDKIDRVKLRQVAVGEMA